VPPQAGTVGQFGTYGLGGEVTTTTYPARFSAVSTLRTSDAMNRLHLRPHSMQFLVIGRLAVPACFLPSQLRKQLTRQSD
jgi:hypothetical protein